MRWMVDVWLGGWLDGFGGWLGRCWWMIGNDWVDAVGGWTVGWLEVKMRGMVGWML